MTWDLSKLGNCPVHGRHTGGQCPLCDSNHPTPAMVPQTAPEPEEDRSKWWTGPEKELHDLFATWLEHHEIGYIHCRTDMKSTIKKGTPDFACFYTSSDGVCRFCMVEFKNKTGRLSKDQVEVIDRHRGRNIPVLVTGDFAEACDFVRSSLLHPSDCALPTVQPQDEFPEFPQFL